MLCLEIEIHMIIISFSKIQYTKFEDGEFPIISDYDYFLTKMYSDYMQLPPEDKRHPYHNATFYWE